MGPSYSVIHNNRLTENHSNPDIDSSRSSENILLIDKPIRKMYKEIFDGAVQEFNARQKRADRKIENYYQKIHDSNLDEAKEVIFEIGDSENLKKIAEAENCEIWETQEWKLRTEVLKNYVIEFQKSNPNFVIFNATIHLDEKNPHAHVDFIPVATNMKKGMTKQVSVNGALADMGFNKTKAIVREKGKQTRKEIIQADNQANFSDWREKQLADLKLLARRTYRSAGSSFEFVEGSKREKHLSVTEFKRLVQGAKVNVAKNFQDKVDKMIDNFLKTDLMTEEDFVCTQKYLDTVTNDLDETDFQKFSPTEFMEYFLNDLGTFFKSQGKELLDKELDLQELEVRLNSELQSRKEEIQRLDEQLEPLRELNEVLDLEIESKKGELSLLDETGLKHLKTEPTMTNYEVQKIISSATSGLGGLKGITLESLKKIGAVINQLFKTVDVMRGYIKQLEMKIKKLENPEKYMSFEERIAQAQAQEKESYQSAGRDFLTNKGRVR